MKSKLVRIALLITGLNLTSLAVESHWIGTENNKNWNSALYWSDGIPGIVSATDVGNSDIAVFDSDFTVAFGIYVDNRNIGGVVFSNSSPYALTMKGTGTLLLSNGGSITFANTHTGATITDGYNANIGISGSGTLYGNITGNSRMKILGEITGTALAGDVDTLYLDGVSTSDDFLNWISGDISDGSNGGKLAVVKNGTGLWTINPATGMGFSGLANTSGGFTLNAGTIRLETSAENILGTGLLTFNGGTLYNRVIRTYNSDIVVGGDFNIINGGVAGSTSTFQGNVDLSGAVRVISSEGYTTSFDGVVSNGGLEKTGSGAISLNNQNTYTNGTLVSEGQLIGGADGAFGSGDVTVAAGAKLGLAVTDAFGEQASLILDSAAELNLAYNGTGTVYQLSLDGGNSYIPGGIYNASNLTTLGSGTYEGDGYIYVAYPVEIGMLSMSLNNSDAIFGWNSAVGLSYALQGRTNLLTGLWSNVLENIIGTGDYIYVTNSITKPQEFYRIIIN